MLPASNVSQVSPSMRGAPDIGALTLTQICRRRHLKTPKALGGGQCFEPPLRRINDVLDADLLSAYMWLPLHQQEALATRCGAVKQTIEQAVLQLIHAVKAVPQQT